MNRLEFPSPTKAEGKFVRQAGPPGSYGHVVLSVEPASSGGLAFLCEVAANKIPPTFRDAVYRGVTELFEVGGPCEGVACDHTVVRVVDGSHHATDSNELSYTMAAAAAFKNAIARTRLK